MATTASLFTTYQSHRRLLQNVDSNKAASYFYYRRATDNSSEDNIQAVKKGQLLLNGNHVEARSVAEQKSDIYFIWMVRAAV